MENISLDGFCTVHIKPESALRERRVILGLTQQAVADRAQIPIQSYQQFESGKRKIRRASFEIACRVIEALEMTPTDFYHADYSDPPFHSLNPQPWRIGQLSVTQSVW